MRPVISPPQLDVVAMVLNRKSSLLESDCSLLEALFELRWTPSKLWMMTAQNPW